MKKIFKNILACLGAAGLFFLVILMILKYAPPSDGYSLGGLNPTIKNKVTEVQKK